MTHAYIDNGSQMRIRATGGAEFECLERTHGTEAPRTNETKLAKDLRILL